MLRHLRVLVVKIRGQALRLWWEKLMVSVAFLYVYLLEKRVFAVGAQVLCYCF